MRVISHESYDERHNPQKIWIVRFNLCFTRNSAEIPVNCIRLTWFLWTSKIDLNTNISNEYSARQEASPQVVCLCICYWITVQLERNNFSEILGDKGLRWNESSPDRRAFCSWQRWAWAAQRFYVAAIRCHFSINNQVVIKLWRNNSHGNRLMAIRMNSVLRSLPFYEFFKQTSIKPTYFANNVRAVIQFDTFYSIKICFLCHNLPKIWTTQLYTRHINTFPLGCSWQTLKTKMDRRREYGI